MTSTSGSTASVLAETLAATPDVLAHLTAAHEAAVDAVDPRLYELCRLRVAALLGTPDHDTSDVVSPATVAALASWPTSDLFTDIDRACLAFAEQFVIDVASLSDAQAAAVSDRLGPQGFADFVHGLLVIEQRQRLQLVWDRLFQETSS